MKNKNKNKEIEQRVFVELYAAFATCILIVFYIVFALQVATASGAVI